MLTHTASISQWIGIERTAERFTPVFTSLIPNQNMPAPTTLTVAEIEPSLPNAEVAEAPWFPAVQQRILTSVPPIGYAVVQDGTWISKEVAGAALQFLGSFSETFLVEPYLYCSPSGDLVAEFESTQNKLTCVIASDSATVYSSTDGRLTPRTIARTDWSPEQINLLVR